MNNLNDATALMESAAISAGHMLLDLQPQSKRLESRKDFLSDADLKSEKMILDILSAAYPDVAVLSEEQGGKESKEGYLWVIDPVDGTINFFLQDDNRGVSIALVKDGKTIAGVVYLPAHKKIYSACSDTVAKFRNVGKSESKWETLKVNKENTLANSQFWFGRGKELSHGADHKKTLDLIAKVDRQTLYPQIRNSAVGDMMAVASGKISGYILPKPEPFDIAAAALIVERAGGKVTDIDGNPWSPFSGSLIATNNVIHDKLLDTIKT